MFIVCAKASTVLNELVFSTTTLVGSLTVNNDTEICDNHYASAAALLHCHALLCRLTPLLHGIDYHASCSCNLNCLSEL